MTAYVLICRYHDGNDRSLVPLPNYRFLGFVEAETQDAAKIKAETLKAELDRHNSYDGSAKFPYSNFYFDCVPVEKVESLGDILRLHQEFFMQSWRWSEKLPKLLTEAEHPA